MRLKEHRRGMETYPCTKAAYQHLIRSSATPLHVQLNQDCTHFGVFLNLLSQKPVSGKVAITEVELNLQSDNMNSTGRRRKACLSCQTLLRTCRRTALRTSSVKAIASFRTTKPSPQKLAGSQLADAASGDARSALCSQLKPTHTSDGAICLRRKRRNIR